MEKIKIRILFIILIINILFSFTCCEKKAALEKTKSDTIVSLTIGEPDFLDPHHAYDSASAEVLYNVYDALIEYKEESVLEFLPRVSENVPSEKDGTIRDMGKTYIFKIKQGIKFHNGNDLSPQDVEYTFERALLLDPDGSPVWMLLDPLLNAHRLKPVVENYIGKKWDHIFESNNTPKPEYISKLEDFYKEIIDPLIQVRNNKVIFHLAKPFPPFLNIMAQYSSWAMILDKEWCVEQGLWDGNPEAWWKYYNLKKEDSPLYAKTMGSGPYKLIDWDRAQKKVILERNENYFRKPAFIRRVIIQGIEEWSTRKAMLQKSGGDIVYVDPEYLEQAKQIKGLNIQQELPILSLTAAQFNWKVKEDSKYIGSGKLDGDGIPTTFFENKNVRMGFVHSFDGETFINEVINKLGFIPPTCLIKGLLGYNENLRGNEFNIEIAKEYFKKAYNGKLWNVGFKMILLYNTGNNTRKNAAELLASGLAKVNPKFQAEVRGVEWPTFLDAQKNQTMPFYIIGWGADYPDPNNFIFTYYHSSGDYGHFYGENYKKFALKTQESLNNMSLDGIIEKAGTILDSEKRIELYNIIQRFVISEGIGLPIVQIYGFNVMQDYVKGYKHNAIKGANHHDFYSFYK